MTIAQDMTDPGSSVAPGEKVNGPVIAVTLAVGIGSLALGLLTTLGEASKSIGDSLNFYDRVGPLSGKTTFAMVIFLGAWLVLHLAFRRRNLAWKPFIQVTVVMFALGTILTFPPFFDLFASD